MERYLFFLPVVLFLTALTSSPPQNIAVTVNPSGGAGCLSGSICPPGNWKIVAAEEFNGTGLDPNGPLTTTTGWCCGNQFWIDNSGDGTGWTPAFTGSTVVLYSYSNGAHGCGSNNTFNLCGGTGFTWKGTTGSGYYEARMKDGSDGAYKVFWTLVDNGDCTGGGAYLTNGFEADISESFGGTSAQVNTHWGGYGGCHNSDPSCCYNPADAFHLWGVQWPDASGGITYWRDGVAIKSTAGPVDTTGTVATGLNGGLQIAGVKGQANGGTMEVDWVRYYQKQ